MAPIIESGSSLPALVDRAAKALSEARSSAEILEARDRANVAYTAAKMAARLAKAKGAHDALIAAAHRAQADALEIEAGAKRRLADEYDAAQARNEVAGHGGARNFKVKDDNLELATTGDIGLTKEQIFEARIIRDAEKADPGIVRRTLDAALTSGKEPTKSQLRKAVSPPMLTTTYDIDQDEHVTDEMIDAASAATRRRVFLRCAADVIRKAQQGAGLRDARGPEIDREVMKILGQVIKVWTDLRTELKQRR
jgi:hypothetical protein